MSIVAVRFVVIWYIILFYWFFSTLPSSSIIPSFRCNRCISVRTPDVYVHIRTCDGRRPRQVAGRQYPFGRRWPSRYVSNGRLANSYYFEAVSLNFNLWSQPLFMMIKTYLNVPMSLCAIKVWIHYSRRLQMVVIVQAETVSVLCTLQGCFLFWFHWNNTGY